MTKKQEIEFRAYFSAYREILNDDLKQWLIAQVQVMRELKEKDLDFSMKDFALQSMLHRVKTNHDNWHAELTLITEAKDILENAANKEDNKEDNN